ncbi:MAG TPA: hypothetical protein GXZ45_01720 [Propionibacterium sp.]|nr:hypothetical protein [Propionibacterium sp.]
MSTAANENQNHADWWAGLSLEERYMAIETVRLDQDADHPHGARTGAERPTGERAEWVRQQPEYLERWAGAENIAQKDDPGFGRKASPDAHDDTQPLTEG